MRKIIRKIKKTIGVFLFVILISAISQFFPQIKSFFNHNSNNHTTSSSSKHLHKEAYYQTIWCNAHSGIMEYKNYDKTRVDCLTKDYAIEFDFAEKWAEGVGQSLYYHLLTGKKAMLILILEYPERQMVYYERAKKLGDEYDIKVEYVTPENIQDNLT